MTHRINVRFVLTTLLASLCLLPALAPAQNQREKAVRDDRQRLTQDPSWVYDNLADGVAAAKARNKPILVLIRCLP